MEFTEDERRRLDIEFQVTSALRDGIWQASGNREKSTYEQAFSLGSQVAPEVYHSVHRLIGFPRPSPLAQEIRQSARAQSALEGRDITPFEYVVDEIAKIKEQISALDADEAQHLLVSKLHRYEGAMQELKPRDHREAKLIFGDAVKSGYGLPFSGEGDGYKDYVLNPQRLLRVRATHLESVEDKIGCDLIYENLDCVNKTARIVMMQYKTWEGNNPLFTTIPVTTSKSGECLGLLAIVGFAIPKGSVTGRTGCQPARRSCDRPTVCSSQTQ